MQVSTKTTVYLDGTEIRDIVAAHLRENGTLPKDGKFDMAYATPSIAAAPVKEAKDLRIQVSWVPKTD